MLAEEKEVLSHSKESKDTVVETILQRQKDKTVEHVYKLTTGKMKSRSTHSTIRRPD
jgi:hypothetical protein